MDNETKLDQINRWMMLAANVGVLLGILFLVFELRQNTIASHAEAASNYQDSFSEIEVRTHYSQRGKLPELSSLLSQVGEAAL